jgi:hypothetical protein
VYSGVIEAAWMVVSVPGDALDNGAENREGPGLRISTTEGTSVHRKHGIIAPSTAVTVLLGPAFGLSPATATTAGAQGCSTPVRRGNAL